MAQCKTVDISSMPHNVLTDFLNGDLSFQDAYKKYPGRFDLEITKLDEDKAEKSNTITLSVRK
jgi:hypothetical protein